MKRRLTVMLSTLIALLLGACSQAPKERATIAPQSFRSGLYLTQEEAGAEALHIRSLIGGLRAGESLEVADVTFLGSNALRSAGADTLAAENGVYLVNFADDNGFVLLSSYAYAEPILAIAEQGNLTCSEEEDEISRFLLDKLLTRHQMTIGSLTDVVPVLNGIRYPADSTLNDVILAGDSLLVEYGEWNTYNYYPAFLPTNWGQLFPYNQYLDSIDGRELPPAGCAATAVGQVLAYYRVPVPAYDWEMIVNPKNTDEEEYGYDRAAQLLKALGAPNLLNISYSLDGSSALSENVPRTLTYYGLRSDSVLSSYNYNTVLREVAAQRPVYIDGASFKITYPETGLVSYSNRHAWLLDGALSMMRNVYLVNRNTGVKRWAFCQIKNLLHCNIGARKPKNGFYVSGAFDVYNGPELLRSSLTPIVEGSEKNYQFALRIITGIRR